MTRGYLTIAVNSPTGDYLTCAEALAHSIRITQGGAGKVSVMVPMDCEVPSDQAGAFDQIIRFDPMLIPQTSWNAYLKHYAVEHSPYDETILMDADVLFPTDLSHWWDYLSAKEMVFPTRVFTFKGAPVLEDTNPYRIAFRENKLPNLYTGVMYFRKTEMVNSIVRLAALISENWMQYRVKRLRGQTEVQPTDDMAMACAVKEFGAELECTIPDGDWLSFVHMKSRIQRVENAANLSEKWTSFMNAQVNPDGSILIGNYLQTRPVHYHDRSFLTPSVLSVLRNA